MQDTHVPIGASIMLGYDGSYMDFLELAVANEWKWVEFKYDPPFLLDSHLHNISPKQLRKFGERHGIGFSMHAPYYETNLGSLNPDIFNASIKACCDGAELAAEMGCRNLTIHGGDLAEQFTAKPELVNITFQRTLDGLSKILRHCSKLGLGISIENRNGSNKKKRKVGVLPDELQSLYAELGPGVGVTLDIGHANVSEIAPAEFATKLAERIRLMHVHDNNGMSDQHRPIGSGSIDFVGLLGLYLKNKWEFPWVVECKKLEDTITSVQQLRKMLADI